MSHTRKLLSAFSEVQTAWLLNAGCPCPFGDLQPHEVSAWLAARFGSPAVPCHVGLIVDASGTHVARLEKPGYPSLTELGPGAHAAIFDLAVAAIRLFDPARFGAADQSIRVEGSRLPPGLIDFVDKVSPLAELNRTIDFVLNSSGSRITPPNPAGKVVNAIEELAGYLDGLEDDLPADLPTPRRDHRGIPE